MRIYYFDTEKKEREYMEPRLKDHEVIFYEDRLQDHSEINDPDVDALCVFVLSSVGPKEMDQFPNLKFIATRSTGFGHIDLEEAEKRGIVVSNVPFYGQNTVAEHAFALLLALSRKIYDAYEQVKEDGSYTQDNLRGFDLKGKTIGIVGTGNIGCHTVAIAHGFGMNILAVDMSPKQELSDKYGVKYVELDELLSNSDVISLHVPYNKHTHHLLNSDNMPKIKRGAYLINTARGGIVDTMPLVKALEDGTLAGAGLDVLEEEGTLMSEDDTRLLYEGHPEAERLRVLLADHYFIEHPRVLITPHIAFNTVEAVERILDTTAENIQGFSGGNSLNIVKK